VIRRAYSPCGELPKPSGGGAIPGGISGTPGEVWSGVTRGENETDRVRAVRRPKPKAAGRRKTGDLHVSGLHTLLEDGAFIIWRETAKKRLVAKLQAIQTELKRRRHEPIASVGAWLRNFLRLLTAPWEFRLEPSKAPTLSTTRTAWYEPRSHAVPAPTPSEICLGSRA
jgi:hypothetical protein